MTTDGAHVFKYAKSSLLNGTLCGRFIFMNSEGIFQNPLSSSISHHSARTASPGLTHVNNCHSISIRVSNRIDALDKATMKRGSSSEWKGRHVLLLRLTGNAERDCRQD